MSTDILSKAQAIMADILRCPPGDLQPETSAADIEAWDSLTNINIIVSLEKAFDIKFALGEIQELANVGDMVRLIGEKSS